MLNAFTVDWEDWYQGLTSTSRRFDEWPQFESRLARNTDTILGLLDAYQVKATFFILGFAAKEYPELVRRVYAAGHEIAVHSYHHRLVYELTPDTFRQDTQLAIDTIQDVIGAPVFGYRAPAFSIMERSAWALPILAELGIRYDSSVFPGKNVLYGWPGKPRFPYRHESADALPELPVSTIRINHKIVPMGGGFYLRALPSSFLKWAIRRIHHEGYPAILYTHPWEIDPAHPKPPGVTSRERLSHYSNLRVTERKLHALLKTFQFTTMQEIAHNMGLM